MAIPDYIKQRFATLKAAAEAGHMALMETRDTRTGAVRYALCAVNRPDGEFEFVPLGDLNASDNPYDDYLPPDPDTESGFITPAPSSASAEAQVRETEQTEADAADDRYSQ